MAAYHKVHGNANNASCPLGELDITHEFIVPQAGEHWCNPSYSTVKKVMSRQNSKDMVELARTHVDSSTLVYRVEVRDRKMVCVRNRKFQNRQYLGLTERVRPAPKRAFNPTFEEAPDEEFVV